MSKSNISVIIFLLLGIGSLSLCFLDFKYGSELIGYAAEEKVLLPVVNRIMQFISLYNAGKIGGGIVVLFAIFLLPLLISRLKITIKNKKIIMEERKNINGILQLVENMHNCSTIGLCGIMANFTIYFLIGSLLNTYCKYFY